MIVNRTRGLSPLPLKDLYELEEVATESLDIESKRHIEFLDQCFPDWNLHFSSPFHKKLLELSISARLLAIRESDVFIDVAGGLYTYVGTVKAARKILQDRFISDHPKRKLLPRGVDSIESSAHEVPLPSSSVDKIACHHSFEHSRDTVDSLFIREVDRLLRPGGCACIVPLHLGKEYLEVTDNLATPKFDPSSRRVYDPTSPLPGGKFSGGLARIYSPRALRRRVLNDIDPKRIRTRIVDLRVEGAPAPNVKSDCHRIEKNVDFPYRASMLDKVI